MTGVPRSTGALFAFQRLWWMLIAVLICTTFAHAQAGDAPHDYDISAGSLAQAVNRLSQQSDVQIIYDIELLKDKTAAALTGRLPLREALDKLLIGSGLRWSYTNATTIVLQAAPSEAKPAKKDDKPMKTQAQEAPTELEKVSVTGSRIPLSVKEQAQPVITITARDIEESGRTTVADLLNTLPQVSMQAMSGNITNFAGQTGVRLHGLPLGSTLTLIDGQPMEFNNYGPFDLSLIPASAIERIEIIPVGSSAIYGSDALAGVVNIVMKKHFDGAEFNVKYGSANSYDDNSVSAAFGKDWGNSSASIVLSRTHQSGLQFEDRPLTAAGNYTSLGGQDWRLTRCNPGTVYGLNGTTLPGLGGSYAAIPAGLTGTPTVADFAPTEGDKNKCNYYLHQDSISPADQTGLIANAHYEITSSLDLFFSLMYSHYQSDSTTTPLLAITSPGYVVSAQNPFNPFGQSVGIDWSYGIKDYKRVVNFLRPVVGVRGDLSDDWHYEVSGTYSRDQFSVLNTSINSAAVAAALASSDPNTALNVFTSGPPGSQKLLESLYTSLYDHFSNGETSLQGLVRGTLFALPAGPVSDHLPQEATTLLFSAKEVVYKALYPGVRKFFDFFAVRAISISSNQIYLALCRDWNERWLQDSTFLINYTFYRKSVITALCLPVVVDIE